MSLIGAIDDATGEVLYALFRGQEDAIGYFQLLHHIVTSHGIPFKVLIADVAAANAQSRASYHSFPQMETDLAAMASSYPAITDLTSIGLSWEGRNIWCLEITDNPGLDEGEQVLPLLAQTEDAPERRLDIAEIEELRGMAGPDSGRRCRTWL